MRVVLVAFGLVLLAVPTALAGTIPDPGNVCFSSEACLDCFATAYEFQYHLLNGYLDTGVTSDAVNCANGVIDCLLIPSTICLIGQL